MTDNLNFRKPHMVVVDGYFYMYDDDTDMLLQKTDDGVTAFSYPFNTLQSETIKSIEHDGINFWSMRNGAAANTLVIERTRIENYICKVKDSFTLSNIGHKFDAETFTVEHYHCSISGSYIPGDTIITVGNGESELPGDLLSGMEITIGPNSAGQTETIEVQHVSGNVVTLSDSLVHTYGDGTEFLFYNYIWLFNNADGTDDSIGALYKLNAYSGSVLFKYPGGVYKDILASTFAQIDHFVEYGTVNSLIYVKASNLLFIDISSVVELQYYGSMAMDTIDENEVNIIDVFDITVVGRNVYRLQEAATYYGQTTEWTTYNYQAATFNQLVSSLAMTATPNVIAANEISTSEITARVRDQFLQPIVGRLVYFSVDAGSSGEIVAGQTIVNTDSNGEASTTYRSGEDAELVKLIARVQQI